MPRLLLMTLPLIFFAGCPSKPTPKPEAAPPSVGLAAPQPTVAPPPAETPPAALPMQVIFLDEHRFAAGTTPFEATVDRTRPPDSDEADALVRAYFEGPTDAERARGLVAMTHGLTGAALRQDGDTLHVFTTGECDTNGAAYNVGTLLIRNLQQVDGVRSVKIYDPSGRTQEPDGPGHSIPTCMEP